MAYYTKKNIERYKPKFPFVIPFSLLSPDERREKGVLIKTYPETGPQINCNFKTWGGTEREKNDIVTVEDTAFIETWYRPDIRSNCRLKRLEDGAIFEIITPPEDIDFRHQYLKFKVRRIQGGA